MKKIELQMTNNELEARVIELEAQLAEAKQAKVDIESEFDDLTAVHHTTDLELEHTQETLEQVLSDVKPERYEDWYRRLHPVAGGEPDLAVAQEPVRIIA